MVEDLISVKDFSGYCNKLVVCPYSEDHKVRSIDIFVHLAKCRTEYFRKTGIRIELKKCEYNGCHYVPSLEFEFHRSICHNYELFTQCEQKMKFPPVPVDVQTSSSQRKR